MACGCAVVASGSAARLVWALVTAGASHPLRVPLSSYYLRLHKDLTFVRSAWSTRSVVGVQLALAVFGLLGAAAQSLWSLVWLALLVGFRWIVVYARRRRVSQIEGQVEGWLWALARALEAAPSLGEALLATALSSPSPMREELEWVQSEMQLGASIERALSAWEMRVGSEVLSLALLTLHIGRQTGGALPQVLKDSASALREMERLRGVIRVKTAEGRAQSMLIGGLPIPLYFAVDWIDSTHFDPLEHSSLGQALVAIAVVLWLAAVFSAKKIMAVRI